MTLLQIYEDLMHLCNTNDAFFYVDHKSPAGGTYRVFSYRLASYTDFMQPNALETRGSMWEIDEEGEMIRCAARTMKKFFNAYENPATMFPANTTCDDMAVVMPKLDGSVISTYRDNDGEIRCKSHTALYSDHAINSTRLINENQNLYQYIDEAERLGYTVNMEYTSPEYRIVLPYQVEQLFVLNVRHRVSGELLCGKALRDKFPCLAQYSTNMTGKDIHHTFPVRNTFRESVEEVHKMLDIEGFVCILNNGTMCKIKTDWYSSLHLTKDSIIIDSHLYEAVLNGSSDDLKQLFSTDEYAMQKILRMEQLVFSCYNALQDEVESFVKEHKHLERKEFAMKVQECLTNELNRQGLAFAMYNNKKVDYKETLIKYMKIVLKDF
ncbi:TPA: RNA ligase, T4 RnlA family [Escherichia coli]|nr:RNA ligase, T4 RnlA family [Escherichia coli]